MENGEELRAWIAVGAFGRELYFYPSIDSTNTRAAELAAAGAPEGTLVTAGHQRRGRGRHGADWQTPPESAVAMSLVLRPNVAHPLRWTGLGALAVAEALEPSGIPARIKWPNDVLLAGRKVAGVLAEAAWEGGRPAHLILGIGINVLRGSVPKGALAFPATSIEEHLGHSVSRPELIAAVLASLEKWYRLLDSDGFLQAWETRLAYRGRRVRVDLGDHTLEGVLQGLAAEGQARLQLDDGSEVACSGEARWLRPVDD